MKISITNSMIMAAVALSSTVLAAPVDSAAPHNASSHNVAFEARAALNFDSMLNGLPIVGPVLAPITSLLDSIGLNGPGSFNNGAPLTEDQKAIMEKLQAAISNAAKNVSEHLPANLPISPPIKKQDTAPEFEGSGSLESKVLFERDSAPALQAREPLNLDSVLGGLPLVGPLLTPITSLLDSIGLNDPSKITSKAPLTDGQKDVLAKLQAALSGAAGTVTAHLPAGFPVSQSVKRQDLASEFESLFEEESGGLEPEGFFKRGNYSARAPLNLDSLLGGLPVVGPLLAPVTSIFDLIGLNDPSAISNKAPLTDAQKDVIAKLQAAISGAAGKVAANLPIGLPVSLPVKRQDAARRSEELFDEGSGSLETEGLDERQE